MAMERANRYRGKVTSRVVIASITASTFGLIVGYSGILGQIASEGPYDGTFLWSLSDHNPRYYDYRKNNTQYSFPALGGVTYLAAALASFLSFPFVSKYGRRKSILLAGVISFIGAALAIYPISIALLIASYIFLGLGIGFGTQAALLYLSEMAPARFRGGLSMMFQLAMTLGMLLENMILGELHRYSMGPLVYIFWWMFPAVPALFIALGGLKLLPETPNSLVGRGLAEKGREVLAKIRGTEDVEAEFEDLVKASEFAKATRQNHFLAMKNIFHRRNRPQLVMAILMPLFQNLTGIVFMLYFAPLLFWSLGSRRTSSTYSTAINGSILIFATLASMVTVDKIGRRVLLVSGGVIMFISQAMISIMLGSNLFSDQLTKDRLSILVTVLIGIFVLAYGWSWGPLGWTIPSEIFTLETRSVGQSIAVSINFLFAYLVLQFFIPLLCVFKYGLFLFFAGWVVAMTIFVYLFVPETKGVPIEEMTFLWSKHWFWNKIVADDSGVFHAAPKSPTPNYV